MTPKAQVIKAKKKKIDKGDFIKLTTSDKKKRDQKNNISLGFAS